MALPGWAGGPAGRYLAPAVFLLAVTAVVLVVRSALRSDTAPSVTTHFSVAPRPSSDARLQLPVAKRYYVIRSGDTLDAIAHTFSTTVDRLLRINPGVEPTALVPGEQLRVK
jgi:LysM repeat protein